MPRSVDDCDVVLGRLELPQRNIDRNTTLTLGFQLVQNPGVFERTFAHLHHNEQQLKSLFPILVIICLILLIGVSGHRPQAGYTK